MAYITEAEVSEKTTISLEPGLRAISNIELKGEKLRVRDAYLEKEVETIKQRLDRTISYVHKCKDCGATLPVPENNGVFHCNYCGACYLVGTTQIMSTY